jgi:predicted N-formylglutamate amidohydrolase
MHRDQAETFAAVVRHDRAQTFAGASREIAPNVACVVTCEHGGNRVPAELAARLRPWRAWLASHRGYDPGALATARTLARVLGAPLVASTVSRLVADLNRSPGREFRGSPIMRAAPCEVRAEAHSRYYAPYRDAVERMVRDAILAGRRVVHVSSHSFTASLDGRVRHADVGLLYDPARAAERELCVRWQRVLAARMPNWSVRRNYPYLGRSDGLTTYLRRRLDPDGYVGVEIEVNQRRCGARPLPLATRRTIALALRDALVDAPVDFLSARDGR